MNINGILHVNVNCSNYERSRRFYEMLGFKTLWEVPEKNSPEVAAAVGMPPYHVKGSIMVIGEGRNSTMLDLLEWKYPRDDEAHSESERRKRDKRGRSSATSGRAEPLRTLDGEARTRSMVYEGSRGVRLPRPRSGPCRTNPHRSRRRTKALHGTSRWDLRCVQDVASLPPVEDELHRLLREVSARTLLRVLGLLLRRRLLVLRRRC